MYGAAGNDQQGADDYAKLLAMISSGYGNQVTPYDVGLDLGPQQVGQAFQQGTADLNARRRQQTQYDIGRWGAQNEADKTQAGLDVADMTNQLGYAGLSNAQEVARIGQEGKIGAAQAKGALDTWRMAEQEKGRNDRAAGRIQNQLQMKNQDLFMKQMLADKGMKFPPADVFNQLVMAARQQFPKATPEEHQVQAIKTWVDLNGALAPEYRRAQAGAGQQQAQEAKPATAINPYTEPAAPLIRPGSPLDRMSLPSMNRWAAEDMLP